MLTQMESDDSITQSHALKGRGLEEEDDSGDLSTSMIAELESLKENLKRAKDAAMQSWLDSRPLIDELEKMQSELASARARVKKANSTISEILAQLGTTDMCIKSTKEEEQKSRMIMNEQNQELHKAQEEMEQLKVKIDQKRRRRSKLKQVLRLKRQSLQTLQLTYEAIQLETEAFATSAAQALHYINNSEAVNIMVQLTQEEYEFLKKEASQQSSLAEWRISVSQDEKLAAENSRDSAFRRLQKIYPRQRNTMEETIGNEKTMAGGANIRAGEQDNLGQFYKAQVKSPIGINRRNPRQQFKHNSNSNMTKKKKSSFFVRIKTFFVWKLSKYFK